MTEDDKVWIVDDDRSIRWVLEKALMQEGFQATAFEDAQHLLNRVWPRKSHTPSSRISACPALTA
jgi:two-component system nitrogen regulation response regulator GlnG